MPARKQVVQTPAAAPAFEGVRSTTEAPLIFVSHDSRDADLAEAFDNLLTDASGGILKSFRSSDRKGTAGIEYGQEWYRAIMQKLDKATDVVALLTTYSINRPWILYEAGVAKGKLAANNQVFGIALGVKLDEAATGPFAQFQNSPDEEDAITGLVLQLIRRHPQASPREEAVRRQVQAFRETVATLLKGRGDQPHHHAARVDETSVAKFFEEIKVLVRDVPDRVAFELHNQSGRGSLKKRRLFHPMMIVEMFENSKFRSSDQIGFPILMMGTTIRDDYPWLYELCIKLYRAIDCHSSSEIESTRKALLDMIEITRQNPVLRDITGQEGEEAMITLHNLERMLRRLKKPPVPQSMAASLSAGDKE